MIARQDLTVEDGIVGRRTDAGNGSAHLNRHHQPDSPLKEGTGVLLVGQHGVGHLHGGGEVQLVATAC